MSLVNNERTKLTANWLNTMAAGTIIAGAVTPLVAIAYGLRTGTEAIGAAFVFAVTAAWILGGIAIHFWARAILGRLIE